MAAEVLKPRARSTFDLIAPDPADPLYKVNPGSFRSELHERLASPFYPIAFIAIAIAFVGQARTNRQGRIKSLMAAFAIAAIVRGLGFAAMNMATLQASAVALVYAIPFGTIALSAFAAWRNMTPRPASRLSRQIETGLGAIFGSLRRMLPLGRRPAEPRRSA